jgi:hypothetical protein
MMNETDTGKASIEASALAFDLTGRTYAVARILWIARFWSMQFLRFLPVDNPVRRGPPCHAATFERDSPH